VTPGCSTMLFDGVHGRPRRCPGEPTRSIVVRWATPPGWMRIYLCERHDRDGTEPMTDAHRADLAWRRQQWAEGLAGRRYTPPPVHRYRDQA
jgi:hypothetical protein